MDFQFLYSGDPSNRTRFSSCHIPSSLILFIGVVSTSLVICILYSLSQLDQQLVLFLRSVHSPLIETVGRVGNRMGDAVTLIMLSLVIMGAGYARHDQRLKLAGLQTLLSHGVAGLVTQIIKHLLGRPRPRMMHQDPFQFGPSFQGGLDAFPSGHASATFAVAAVLANYFPRAKFFWYAMAWFVSLCRIMRGSHYPTDVFAGALLGHIVGCMVVYHVRDWRESFLTAISQGLPWMAASFSVVWIILHRQESNLSHVLLLWSGILTVLIGIGIRAWPFLNQRSEIVDDRRRHEDGYLLIGIGVALSTESLLIVGLACLSFVPWLSMKDRFLKTSDPLTLSATPAHRFPFSRNTAQETMVVITVFLLLILIQHIQGLLPLA